MEFPVEVNGRMVNAVFTDENIRNILLPMLRRLASLQKAKGERILMMLAAPPASGKSTLAQFLAHLSCTEPGLVKAAAVGMDGFHRYGRELKQMTAIRGGREVALSEIKGAPVTFDLPRLTEAVLRLKRESSCTWPLYDRRIHDPVEDALQVTEDIVILEGNYLLLDEPGWRDLHRQADLTVRILADEKDLRERLIQRKAASGISREEAERFVEFSDMANVREVMTRFLPADLTLRLLQDGTYEAAGSSFL